jgi:hypothetical protein
MACARIASIALTAADVGERLTASRTRPVSSLIDSSVLIG